MVVVAFISVVFFVRDESDKKVIINIGIIYYINSFLFLLVLGCSQKKGV